MKINNGSMENDELNDSFDDSFSELSHSQSTGNIFELSQSGSEMSRTDSIVSLSDSETDYIPYRAHRLRRRGSAPPAALEHLKSGPFNLTQKQIIEEDESSGGEAKFTAAFPVKQRSLTTRRGSLPPAFLSEIRSVRESATDRDTQEFGSAAMSRPYHSAILNRFYQRLNAVPQLARRSSTEDLNDAYKKVGIKEADENAINLQESAHQTQTAHNSNFLSMLGVAGYRKPTAPTSPETNRKGYWLSSMFAPAPAETTVDIVDGGVKKAVSVNPPKKSVRRRDINCFAPTSM